MYRFRKKRFRARSQHGRFTCPSDVEHEVCAEVMQGVWSLKWYPSDAKNSEAPPQPYIDLWKNCVEAASDEALCLHNRFVAVQLVTLVRNNAQEKLEVIRECIATKYPDRGSVQGLTLSAVDQEQATIALAFAVKMWLHLPFSFDFNRTQNIPTLAEWAKAQLPSTATKGQIIPGTLSSDFCISHFKRKGGMNVVWEDDISQHLKVDSDNRIHVFRHSAMLTAMKDSPQPNPFPKGFIEETLQTLYLLFRPLESRKQRRSVRMMEKNPHIDLELAIAEQASFDLNNYRYWHERLAKIQTAYDRTSPTSLQQWWFDRRDRVQWATFWTAFVVFILTVIFGVISSVTGILQVMAAY